jgi:predicted nucleic acid-binding protein
MIYLDSNIFIYACLNSQDVGEKSRRLLKEVELGKTEAASSALSFDEITWAVKKYRSLEQSIAAGDAFVNMPELVILPVDESTLRISLDLMRRYAFDPRDCIHAASAILCKADTLVSADSHFDISEEIPRKLP